MYVLCQWQVQVTPFRGQEEERVLGTDRAELQMHQTTLSFWLTTFPGDMHANESPLLFAWLRNDFSLITVLKEYPN